MKSIFLTSVTLITFFASIFLMPTIFHVVVAADDSDNTTAGIITNPLCPPGTPADKCIDTLPKFVTKILDVVKLILLPFVVFFIIWAGFLFVTARGNPSKLENAKLALLGAVIGAVLVLGAHAFSLAIQATVNNLSTP